MLRILWNDPGLIGFALDMGAAAVIVPMTNSVAQVEAMVKAAKYPPLGQRSWGGYTMLQAAGVSAGENARSGVMQKPQVMESPKTLLFIVFKRILQTYTRPVGLTSMGCVGNGLMGQVL